MEQLVVSGKNVNLSYILSPAKDSYFTLQYTFLMIEYLCIPVPLGSVQDVIFSTTKSPDIALLELNILDICNTEKFLWEQILFADSV